MAKKKSEAITPEVIDKPLDERQKTFCELYVIDFHATNAAIGAGYSKKTARSQASDLLTRPNIAQYIKELQEKKSERNELTADRLIKELKSVGFSNIKQIASWDENGQMFITPSEDMPDEVAASIESIKMTKVTVFKKYDEKEGVEIETENTTLTVKLHKKMPAVLLMMKHKGMLDAIESDEDQVLRKALAEIKRGR